MKKDNSHYEDDKIMEDEMGVQGSTHMDVRFAYKISSDKWRQNMYDFDLNGGIIQELRRKCRELVYKLVSFGTKRSPLGTVCK